MAKRTKPSETVVTLRTKGKKGKTQEFGIGQALRLLKLPGCAWELHDDNFEFTGNDIKRRASKGKNTKSEE
jgi:hypothetical protein